MRTNRRKGHRTHETVIERRLGHDLLNVAFAVAIHADCGIWSIAWHVACFVCTDSTEVDPMKHFYKLATPMAGQKSKKQRKTARKITASSIAQRYMELRRLRERVSEIEAWRGAR